MQPTKYVNPMVDVAFKQIFGQEKNKRLMRELLEHVFRITISELNYVNVEHPGRTYEDRNAVFDLECRSDQIGDFIVEVQVKEQKHFAERALYYGTIPIAAQAPRGEWNYALKPVFFLGFVNFALSFPGEKEDGCIHRYSLRNDSTGARMTDCLQFVFMEVQKFDKPLDDCGSFEEKLLYYFKNLPTFAEKPPQEQDSYFEELLTAAEYARMNRSTMTDYERRLKIMRDNWSAEQFMIEKATTEGLEKGMKEGREKGIKEGLEKGMKEGLKEGKAEAERQIAERMLSEGFSKDQVSRLTGLPIDLL